MPEYFFSSVPHISTLNIHFPNLRSLTKTKKNRLKKSIHYWVTWIITNTECEKTYKKVKPQSVYSLMTIIRPWLKLDMTEYYKSWDYNGRAGRENSTIALMPQAAFITYNLPDSPSLERVMFRAGFCSEVAALTDLSLQTWHLQLIPCN